MESNTSYLYRHIRLDKNEPFYIGIGTKSKQDLKYGTYNRAYAFGPKSRNKIWKYIVAKTKYEVEILLDDLSEEEVKLKEIEFIKLYGRIDLKTGTLANLTDGGEGNNGAIRTKEWRDKIGASNKGKTSSRKGVIASTETRKRLSNSHKERYKIFPLHPNSLKALDRTGKKDSPETIQLKSKRMKGEGNPFYNKHHSTESKDKISQKHKELFKNGYIHPMLGKTHTKEAVERIVSKTRKPILQFDKDGNFIKEWSCAKDTLLYGFNPSLIGRCCKGYKKNKHHKGFIWKFKEKC